MIKQIQLRGITRNPSDRQTPDGGCAESINAYLDEQETAPAPIASNISNDIYPAESELTPLSDRYPIRYIHKLPAGGEIYIGVKINTGSPTTYTLRGYKDRTIVSMDNSLSDEPKQFASIGNTIIVFTDNQPYYFLFKEGSYIALGSQIPQPEVEIFTRPSDSHTRTGEITPSGNLASTNDIDTWDDAKRLDDTNHTSLMQTMEDVWNWVVKNIDNRRTDGIFAAPFFIRYALKLYDNSYIYASTPILCGAGESDNWIESRLVHQGSGDPLYKLSLTLTNLFKVRVKGQYQVENWSDIVKSIDFFVSTPIYTPAMYAAFNKLQAISGVADRWMIFNKMDEDNKEQTIKDEVLSKGQFYKIKTIDLKDSAAMRKLSSGAMRIENSEEVSGDLLLTHEVMPESYRDATQYIPINGTLNFNNRIMLEGAKEILPRGDMFLNGQTSETTLSSSRSNIRYLLRFKIVNPNNGEVSYVMSHYRDASTSLLPGYIITIDGDTDNTIQYHGNEDPPSIVTTGHTVQYADCEPYAWVCYPDTRCTQVEIRIIKTTGSGDVIVNGIVPLEPHPLLECAYAFFGFGTTWFTGMTATGDWPTTENRAMLSNNKIFLSAFENPFLFPAGNIITFNDNVIGAAVTSVPLSEGQLGDFDVYVFTADGIRVLGTNSEGTFSAKTVPPNIARHVALPGTILGIEQIIVFTTERGVMLISGSSVQCISNLMNGRHWMLDDGLPNNDRLTSYIGRTEEEGGWAGYGSVQAALNDESTFMQYMKEAKVAYDYNGRRLLFCKDGVGYFYTYMLDTATWHKMISEETTRTILNSFPECLMASESNGAGVVFDYSTVLDDSDVLSDTGNVRYSLIATRPLDLGEPDIRKAIKDLRVRGRYNNKADVKYILLGSMDGTNWNILRSLRGGSFKWFRIVLLCGLSPTERITWIDVDFETRFANRLR